MIVLGVAVLVAAAVFLLGFDGNDETTAGQTQSESPTTEAPKAETGPTAEATTPAAKAKPSPGPLLEAGTFTEIEVDSGDVVRFRARSQSGDQIHVHGYDIERELPAGKTVKIRFEAGLEGVFEIELHEAGERVGELTVNP